MRIVGFDRVPGKRFGRPVSTTFHRDLGVT
jgi:hypothetical protein